MSNVRRSSIIPNAEFPSMCSHCRAKFTRYIDKLTNKISNSHAQNRQVSQPYSDALPSPSSPTRPGSSILIGSRSEGSLTAENHAPLWTGKELINRRMSFAQYLGAD